MNLHSEIMNIHIDKFKEQICGEGKRAYKNGHRDARHAAAELSLKVEARIEELEDVLKAFVDWKTNEEGTLSLVDDEELWKRAEEVLNK